MHNRWRSQLCHRKKHRHRKQPRFAQSTNRGEAKWSYLTHRKLLSLVQIHHQNGRRRRVSGLAAEALVPFEDLEEIYELSA